MRRRPEPATAGHVTRSWARAFRALYFFRVGFSIAWVALVSTLASSATPGDTPGVLAGILLVCYPVSDAVATVFDLRANRRAASRWLQQINLMAGVAGAGGILIALLASLSAAITVFGIWAVASGIIMAVLALRRRRVLGGQWLMIISGAGSVFAGITFIGWTGTLATGLAVLAQYSAGGALWYLLAGFWLLRSARPSSAADPRQTPHLESAMPESPSLPEFSRRRLLLSGLVAVPATTVLAATATRPGAAHAASTQAPRPAWPAADSAADASRVYFC
jgi:uncharacterized membrane protein HdeD (DUF308 family)